MEFSQKNRKTKVSYPFTDLAAIVKTGCYRFEKCHKHLPSFDFQTGKTFINRLKALLEKINK